MKTPDKNPIITPAEIEEPEKYPLLIRIFGVLSIIAGGVQIVAFVLLLLAVFFGRIDFTQLEAVGHGSITTIVIGVVALVLSTILAALFFALGIRLVRGNRKRAALLCNIMIALEFATLVCQFMLTGFNDQLIAPGVNMIILVFLQSYSDPALAQERRLQRHLQSLQWKAEAEDGTLGRDPTGKGYITLNFFNLFWVFVICCFLGLLVEIAYHMAVVDPGVYEDRAGLLYGPFSPIYGVGAVLMTIALNRFHDKSPILIFVISAIIGGAFEFFVSWFMETAFGIVAWDYSGTFLNIGGRTNFMFMCMWGALGFLWVRFALPKMLEWVNVIPWNWRYGVTSVCAVLMFVDAGLTLAAFDCWYQREANEMDYANASAIVEFCNENYDNDFMENRFQSMSIDPSNASRA